MGKHVFIAIMLVSVVVAFEASQPLVVISGMDSWRVSIPSIESKYAVGMFREILHSPPWTTQDIDLFLFHKLLLLPQLPFPFGAEPSEST